MSREYKTVRVAHETKYWINELIFLKEEQLKSEKNSLIDKYESILRFFSGIFSYFIHNGLKWKYFGSCLLFCKSER